jgi:PAS domain S-box-containing protein
VPIAALDRRSCFVWVSEGWAAMEQRLLPRRKRSSTYLSLCAQAPRACGLDRVSASLERVLAGQLTSAEEDYRFPSPERHWRVRITRGEGAVAALVFHREVTHEKVRARDLEQVSQQIELMAEDSVDAVTLWDHSGRCVWASPSVQRVLGHPPAAFLGRKPDWLVPRRSQPTAAQLAKLPTGMPLAFTVTLPVSGTAHVFEVRVHRAATEPFRMVAVARNIDERVQYERRIHWKQVALESAEELGQLGIWVWRRDEAWEWSPSLFVLHGLTARRPPSPSVYLRAVHPEDREPLKRLFRGRLVEEATFRFRRADELVRTFRLRCRVGPEGERVGVVRDVSEELTLQQNIVRLYDERAELLREHFTTRDRERLALAQELHDQLGASLTALLLTSKRLSNDDAPRDNIRRLAQQAHELLDTVRGFTRTLHVSHLDVLPFAEAMKRLVDGYRDATNARLTLELIGALPSHPPPGLLRIAQECLTNAVRHSKASRVHVSCAKRAKEMVLAVEDNGTGLRASDGQGMGLSGIIHRAEAMGGSAQIHSRRGHGTRIEVRVPSLFRGWSSP